MSEVLTLPYYTYATYKRNQRTSARESAATLKVLECLQALENGG